MKNTHQYNILVITIPPSFNSPQTCYMYMLKHRYSFASCCICHSTPPLVLYFPYITRNGALTNLLFFRGRISKIDSQRNAVEQVKEIVSPSLLPQKWEMDLAKNFFDERFAFMDSEWLPHGGVSLENELSGDFDLGEQQDPQPSTEPKRPRLSFLLKKGNMMRISQRRTSTTISKTQDRWIPKTMEMLSRILPIGKNCQGGLFTAVSTD